MKVAICISGGVKYPELSLNSIKKLKDKYNCSIFIHTWLIENKQLFIKNSANSESIIELDESYIKKYNPTNIKFGNFSIEKENIQKYYNNLKFTTECPTTHGIGPLSMFYSIEQSNNIKTEYEINNNIEFDCVIRMRFDTEIKSDIILENYDLSKLNIPKGRDYGGINDQFAFGNSNIMNLYSNVYTTLPLTRKTLYHPEHMLDDSIKYHNIPVNRVDLNVEINNGKFKYE